jgi:hypothetical protein
MFNRFLLVATASLVFLAIPALATPKTGCRKFNFTGSFLAPDLNRDVFGDGSTIHSFAFQLTLNSDGTATQYWTGLPDYALNLGTGSPQIGSWTCRDDGKLIISLIQASYAPVGPGPNPNVVNADVELFSHSRTTYLFSVDNDNTLTRLQSRTRTYDPSEDPTNASAGTLGTLSTLTRTYTRQSATDADLLAP